MSDLDVFDLLPLRMDPQSKAIEPTKPSRSLTAELTELNALHRSLLQIENPVNIPGPPIPMNPKRSAQVTKLRDNGNTEFRKANYIEAVRMYTLGLQMALARPVWEPETQVREEISGLLANRAQAHMALSAWAEGGIDAEASVEAKKVGNAKAWWRRGKCLCEMGRWEEAREWVSAGLEVEGNEADLVALLKEIDEKVNKDVPKKAV